MKKISQSNQHSHQHSHQRSKQQSAFDVSRFSNQDAIDSDPIGSLRRTSRRTLVAAARTGAVGITVFLAIAACGGGGGGGGSSPTSASSGTDTSTGSAPGSSPATQPPSSALPVLAMPANIANGSVVELECGRTYAGTLDLRNKSGVTVRTAGSCGKAVLSPGQAVTGWTQHQGNVYSAPIPFDAAQLILDGEPLRKAHWPNRPQTWAKAASSNASSLNYAMPNGDLAGATLVFRPYEWAVEARRITGYANNTMTLASTGNYAYDGYSLAGQPDFYVEGKLWMLDTPGEWAVSNGRLYVWAPDGASPEGRVWASPDKHGIDATDSSNVAIDNLRIYGAADGIRAYGASGLKATGVEIVNSSENGIAAHGGSGLSVDGAAIRNSRHDAITVHWGGGGETIRNTRIEYSGMTGMPANARAAINLTASSGATIANNTIAQSGYIGIRAFRNAVISGNTVDTACTVLTDCGGIFASAPDKQPLNTRIESNVVRNVAPSQRLAWGIYVSDHANALTVAGNTISGSGNGMQIIDSYNVRVTGNAFMSNTQSHIQLHESGSTPTVRNNTISGNTFTATKEETYRTSSDIGSDSVAQFAAYAANTYFSLAPVFANFNGSAMNFTQWQTRTGQDGDSTFRAQ